MKTFLTVLIMVVAYLAICAAWMAIEHRGAMKVWKQQAIEDNACPRIMNWTGGFYPGWEWRENKCTGQYIDARYDGRLVYELARIDTTCFDTIYYDKQLTDIFTCFRKRGYK